MTTTKSDIGEAMNVLPADEFLEYFDNNRVVGVDLQQAAVVFDKLEKLMAACASNDPSASSVPHIAGV